MKEKTYLGDAVYAENDGFGVILTVEYGNGPTPVECIYLEPSVFVKLQEYITKC